METKNLLALAAEARELDRKTIEEIGIPGAVLMENAGRATVEAMERHFGPVAGKAVAVFAGPGNNGGDGLVIARRVADQGGFPLVLLVANPAKLPPDAARNWAIYERLNLPRLVIDPQGEWSEDLPNSFFHPLHSVVDALFGIGLTRGLSGLYALAVQHLTALAQAHSCPVTAVDLPSGINADTGEILGQAVQADLTVSYGLAKPGQFHNGGAALGRLEVVDIGIPPQVVAEAKVPGRLLDSHVFATLPSPALDSHKGANGHVLLVAGSTGKSGAAILTAKGALAAGAGLLSAALPALVQPIFATALPEAMTERLESPDFCAFADHPRLTALCAGKEAVVIGPGLGQDAASVPLVLALYQEQPEPLVVDADALNILAAHPETLAHPGGPRVFTPHPGEMARLLACPVPDLQKDRLAAAQKLCALCGDTQPIVVLLKGAGTVVAGNSKATRPDSGLWAINSSGNPGMATGGMGDVLAGMIAALIARKAGLWEAATAAVWLHGAAADRIAATKPFGYTAGEVAEAVPHLFQTLKEEKRC